jgi:formylglycine-generating enzyme required for sulfatase activity
MPDSLVLRVPLVTALVVGLVRSTADPPRAAMPPGFVYVPAGRFLFGSDREERFRREFLGAQPLHQVHGAAFWIARTEVTWEDWLAYLRALPPALRVMSLPSSGVGLERRGGRFVLTLEVSASQKHSAAEGERLVYPGRKVRREVRWERLPVSGVSYLQARVYTTWLDRTGRLPGARICTVREWEHAARGADGRSFPHGDALDPSEANVDLTYGRVPLAYGPDEVGSFPASDSPYAIADLAGNVWELTAIDETGKAWYRGGSFYQPTVAALADNMNNPADPTLKSVRIGMRVCADVARAR